MIGIFHALADQRAPWDRDLAVLNEELAEARAAERLVPEGSGFAVADSSPQVIDRFRHAIARDAGALLLAHADAIAERLAQADAQVAELVAAERETLRVGSFPSALGSIVPAAILSQSLSFQPNSWIIGPSVNPVSVQRPVTTICAPCFKASAIGAAPK